MAQAKDNAGKLRLRFTYTSTASDRRDVRVGQGSASQDKQHGKAQQQTAAVAPPEAGVGVPAATTAG